MVKFGFVRHARTLWNLEKKIQGRTDIDLSRQGIREAHLWGEILRPEKYDLILSSPMVRARQTSKILADKLGITVEVEKDLREQDFGAWEGRRLMDIRQESPGEIERQESRGWEFCPPGGESRIHVLKRSSRAIEKAADAFDRKHVLMVSHSSVMKILIYKGLNRTFTPDEDPVLKAYHLHVMTWNQKMRVKFLNCVNLAAALPDN